MSTFNTWRIIVYKVHINLERAITIGLLPEIDVEKFMFVGNGALLGERLVSVSREMMGEAQNIAAMMTNIELSENTDFMNNYIAALFLPHTNNDEFPSVRDRLSGLADTKPKRRTTT